MYVCVEVRVSFENGEVGGFYRDLFSEFFFYRFFVSGLVGRFREGLFFGFYYFGIFFLRVFFVRGVISKIYFCCRWRILVLGYRKFYGKLE